MKRDPLKLYGLAKRLPGMSFIVRNATKKPYIGVSQGGSSRPGHPAKIAATTAAARAQLNQKETEDAQQKD